MDYDSNYDSDDELNVFYRRDFDAKEHALTTFGDAIRPITHDDLRVIPDQMSAIDFIAPALRMERGEIDGGDAEMMKDCGGQEVLDTKLKKLGKLAWEDIGVVNVGVGMSDEEVRLELHHLRRGRRHDKLQKTDLGRYCRILHLLDQGRQYLANDGHTNRLGWKRARGYNDWQEPEDEDGNPRDDIEYEVIPSYWTKDPAATDDGNKACEFIDRLPAELRNAIYQLVINNPINSKRVIHIFPVEPNKHKQMKDGFKQAREPGILLANRQIREEALPVYYDTQKIIAVVPTLSDNIASDMAMHHLNPILPYARNIVLLYQFNYDGHIKHRPLIDFAHLEGEARSTAIKKGKRHVGTATIRASIVDDELSLKVYVDANMEEDQAHVDCCDRSTVPQIQEGIAEFESMLEEAVGQRKIVKQGETTFIFIARWSRADVDLAKEWEDAFGMVPIEE